MTKGLTHWLSRVAMTTVTACGASDGARAIDMELAPAARASVTATESSVPPRRAKRPTGVVASLMGVSVGEPLDEIIAEVGGPVTINDPVKEESEWVELGYEPANELPFTIGFDKAVTFNRPNKPVYMVFAKNEVVALIRFSAYVASPDEARKAEIGASCGLLAEPTCVERTLGADFLLERVPEHQREVHHYLSLGLSVTIEADSVRVIDVYGALSPETEERVVRGIERKRKRLGGE